MKSNLWVKYATVDGLKCGSINLLGLDFTVKLFKDPAKESDTYLKLTYGKKITDKNPYTEGNYIEI